MSSTESITFKDLGAQAWKDENYQLAIDQWTKAIEKSTDNDKELLKTIYSNRSAAYLKLKKFSNALDDANQCNKLDSTWVKGLIRKGDALYALGRYTDSYNSYNSALRIASSSEKANINEKIEKAMSMIAGHSNNTNSNTSSSTNTTSKDGISSSIQKTLRLAIFVNLILYILPFGLSSYAAKLFSLSAILVHLITLYNRFGLPKFTMAYATTLFSDSTTMTLFLALLLLVSKPYLLAMLPIALTEITSYTHDICSFVRSHLPSVQAQLIPLISRFAPSILGGADPTAMLNEVFSPRSEAAINTQLHKGAAYCEVMQGLFVILELILPTRNLMFTIMWWQYLQMRYMIDKSGNIRSAFLALDQQILSVLTNKLCPPMLLGLYNQLKEILAKRVQPPTPGSQGAGSGGLSSMLSSCNIM